MSKKENGGLESLIKRALVSAAGVFLGSYFVDGIDYHEDYATLGIVVALLAVLTAFVKPLLVFFALPLVVMTLGVAVLFINAALYMLVGHLVDGFDVATFGDAFWGAFMITLLNMLFSSWIGGEKGSRIKARMRRGPNRKKRVTAKDDVIDI